MERAAAVQVLDSTLQRQAKDFFQNLTVEVAGSEKAALVYSLTWSAREALGNVGLLAEIDKLASRVDQLREPVSGDEVLPILHGVVLNINRSPDSNPYFTRRGSQPPFGHDLSASGNSNGNNGNF